MKAYIPTSWEEGRTTDAFQIDASAHLIGEDTFTGLTTANIAQVKSDNKLASSGGLATAILNVPTTNLTVAVPLAIPLTDIPLDYPGAAGVAVPASGATPGIILPAAGAGQINVTTLQLKNMIAYDSNGNQLLTLGSPGDSDADATTFDAACTFAQNSDRSAEFQAEFPGVDWIQPTVAVPVTGGTVPGVKLMNITVTPDVTPPVQPTAPVVSNVGDTTATVTWTKTNDGGTAGRGFGVNKGFPAAYEFFVDGVSAGKFTIPTPTSPPALTYNLTGLSAGRSHSLTFTAIDGRGNTSVQSPATSFVTTGSSADTQAPTVPGAPSFTNVTTTGATATWTASTDNTAVAGYDVYVNGTLAGSSATNSIALSSLTPTTTYSVTVKAKDAAGNVSAASAAGSLTTATPPDTTAPSAPGTPAFASITGTSATVNWAASTDNVSVASYEVFVDGVSKGTSTTNSFNLTGLTNATTYAVTVKAKDPAGNVSAASAAGSLKTLDTAAPSAPTGVGASNLTPTSATINWTASNDNVGVASYEVFLDGVSKGTSTSTSLALTGLTANTTYAVTVKAKDAAANVSAASAAFSLVIPAAPDTTAPTVPGAPSFTAVTETSATATWTASTDAGGAVSYEVFVGGVSKGTSTTNSFNLTGLTASTTYAVTVKAKDPSNNVSAASAAGSLTTLNPPDTTGPSTPGTPAFASITGTSATVNWTASTDPSGVASYEVFVDGASKGTSTTNSFALTGLTNGTTYAVTVKAKDTLGNVSAASAAGSLKTPDTAAPSAPTAVTATGVTPTAATITWTASNDNVAVASYEVFLDGVSKGTSTSTSLALTGLTTGTYAVTVKAKDAAGNVSAASGAYSLVIQPAPDTQAPTVPGTPTFASITGTSATVNWAISTDNVSVASYEVFVDGVSKGTATTNSFALTGLTNATTYAVTVKAKDAAGNVSAASAAGSLKTLDTAAPSAPGAPTFSAVTRTGATATWTASNDNVGVASYEVFVDGASKGTSTTTTFALTGLTAGQTYAVTVKAKDAAGNVSAASGAGSLTTTPAADTAAPSAPGTPAFTNITTAGATVAWAASNDNVGVTGYEVFVDGVSKTTTNGSTTTVNLTGLTPNTTYAVTVKAKDAAGNVSAASAAGSLKTSPAPDTTAPTAPGTPAVTNITTTGATVAWAASSDAVGVTGYDVYLGSSTTPAASTNGSTLSVALTGLTPTTNYSVTVKAKDAAGNVSTASAAATFKTATPADTQVPSTPGKPTVANITAAAADVSWAASNDNVGVTGYDVYDNGTKVASVTGTTYTLAGLAPLSNHSVTVRAKDAAGNLSVESAATTFQTKDNPDTQAPSDVTNLAFTATQSSITLTWTAANDNKGVVAYDVYEGATKVGEATATTITINNLTAGSVHTYKVVARDAAGNVSAGATIQATVKSAPPVDTTAPTKPGPITSSNVTTTSVKLTWASSTDNTAVTGYDLYQGATKVQTLTGTTATVSGLTANTSYTFTVKAFDAAGNVSLASEALTVKTDNVPSTVPVAYKISGKTDLKNLARGALPLAGNIQGSYDTGSGAFSGDLALDQTQGNLTALGFLPLTATVQFAQVGKTTGSINSSNVLTTNSKVTIKLPKVSLFGLQLAGGTGCQTATPSDVTLKSTGAFNPANGGSLTGSYAISALTNCGPLNNVVSGLTAGSGNTIAVNLTPAQQF